MTEFFLLQECGFLDPSQTLISQKELEDFIQKTQFHNKTSQNHSEIKKNEGQVKISDVFFRFFQYLYSFRFSLIKNKRKS